jgi:hypothetical protein
MPAEAEEVVCCKAIFLETAASRQAENGGFRQRRSFARMRPRPRDGSNRPERTRMLAEDLRQAITVAPRERLSELSAVLWKGFAAGAVTEADAEDLSNLIAARKAVGSTHSPAGSFQRGRATFPPPPSFSARLCALQQSSADAAGPRPVGCRPRSPATSRSGSRLPWPWSRSR